MMIKKYLSIFCLFLLVGCGFRPMYLSENDKSVMTEASLVQVTPVAGELGYLVTLSLRDRLNASQTDDKKYTLDVVFQDPVSFNQSIRSDNFASLENMNLTVTYQLIDKKTNKVLVSSSLNANGLYNLVKEPYATVVAKDKLYHNLAEMLADDIATHILAYFKGVQ